MMIFTARSLGYICGYVTGGAAFDTIESGYLKRLIIFVLEILCGGAAFVIPFCPNLSALSAAFFGAGICLSALDTGYNTYMLHMWGRKSNPYYLCLHFFFGAGGLIGPVLARIFVEDVKPSAATLNATLSVSINDIFTDRFPSILYSYIALCCMFLFVAALWFLTLCCQCDIAHLGSTKAAAAIKVPTKKFTIFVVMSTCLLMFLTGSIDLGYVHMLSTYALEGYRFSTVNMVNLTAIFWGFYTIGGALAIFFAFSFHPFFMIILCLLMETAAGLVLILLSKSDNDMLALGNALLGIGAAALCGWTILWMDRYIVTTYKIVSTLFVVESLAEMVVPQILAITLEMDTNSLSYFVISVPALYFIFLTMQCLCFFIHGEKYISLSRLPEKKRKRRVCPIFLESKRKGSDEIVLESTKSLARTQVSDRGAFLVTRKDSGSQTDGYLSDIYMDTVVNSKKGLVSAETPRQLSLQESKSSSSSRSEKEDTSQRVEKKSEETPRKEKNSEEKSEKSKEETSNSEGKSDVPKKESSEKSEPQSPSEEEVKALPQRPRAKTFDWFGLGRKSSDQENK